MAQPIIAPPVARDQRRTMTYEDFLAQVAEGAHAEWVNGEAIILMPPTLLHQRLLLFLARPLADYAERHGLGEVCVAPFAMLLLAGASSREPDILFVAREHADRLTAERLDGPADLAIEIVSESSVVRDRVEKFREYEAAGVREYLIVDPLRGRERIDWWRLDARGKYAPIAPDAAGRYHSSVLPGFWLHPDWCWQDPLPNPQALLSLISAPPRESDVTGQP